jgi:hypothetical protein
LHTRRRRWSTLIQAPPTHTTRCASSIYSMSKVNRATMAMFVATFGSTYNGSKLMLFVHEIPKRKRSLQAHALFMKYQKKERDRCNQLLVIWCIKNIEWVIHVLQFSFFSANQQYVFYNSNNKSWLAILFHPKQTYEEFIHYVCPYINYYGWLFNLLWVGLLVTDTMLNQPRLFVLHPR